MPDNWLQDICNAMEPILRLIRVSPDLPPAFLLFSLRELVRARALRCGKKMKELELSESGLSVEPLPTWRDVAFGLRELDATIRNNRRPTVQQIREKFSWSEPTVQTCSIAD